MSNAHVARLELERHHAGELDEVAASAQQAHLVACAACRELAAALEAEREDFARRIPFARFESGVRAKLTSAVSPWRRWLPSLLPLAAVAAVLLLVVRTPIGEEPALELPALEAPVMEAPMEAPGARNRLKGGGGVTLRIAGSDGQQRSAGVEPEVLAAGDRVRLGVEVGSHRYALALSIDEAGEVTPLVHDSGGSVRVEDATTAWFPEAWEFIGAGAEAVVVVLTDAPLTVDEAREAAHRAYEQAGGDVQQLPALALPGEQFQRILLKP